MRQYTSLVLAFFTSMNVFAGDHKFHGSLIGFPAGKYYNTGRNWFWHHNEYEVLSHNPNSQSNTLQAGTPSAGQENSNEVTSSSSSLEHENDLHTFDLRSVEQHRAFCSSVHDEPENTQGWSLCGTVSTGALQGNTPKEHYLVEVLNIFGSKIDAGECSEDAVSLRVDATVSNINFCKHKVYLYDLVDVIVRYMHQRSFYRLYQILLKKVQTENMPHDMLLYGFFSLASSHGKSTPDTDNMMPQVQYQAFTDLRKQQLRYAQLKNIFVFLENMKHRSPNYSEWQYVYALLKGTNWYKTDAPLYRVALQLIRNLHNPYFAKMCFALLDNARNGSFPPYVLVYAFHVYAGEHGKSPEENGAFLYDIQRAAFEDAKRCYISQNSPLFLTLHL